MDKFKVGQKARVARRPGDSKIPLGAECVIGSQRDHWCGRYTNRWRFGYLVMIDGDEWLAEEWQLEPLTDRGFDSFMERVLKPVPLGSPEPVSPR